MEEPKKRERILWLDSAKGLAISFVVLGHVLLGYVGNNAFPSANSYILALKNFIYVWHMPFFMFLSGIAFQLSIVGGGGRERINTTRLKQSVINWIILYVVFEILLSVSTLFFSDYVNTPTHADELIWTLLFPNKIMWYLWAIVILYLLFPIVLKSKVSPLVVVMSLSSISIATYIIHDTYGLRWCFRGLFGCAVWFYVGILFRQIQESRHREDCYHQIAVTTISLVCLICYLCLQFMTDYACWNVWLRGIINFVVIGAIIFLLMECMLNVGRIGNNKLLVSMGKASLVIYIVHTYFISMIKYAVLKIGYQNAVISIVSTFVVAIFISYFIFLLSKRFVLIGYIFRPYDLIKKQKEK